MNKSNIQPIKLKTPLASDRLLIEPLLLSDKKFILELVNTDGWLKFIGNRNINSEKEAAIYIQKIIDNPNAEYFVVKLKDKTKIGIITFIKRDYLESHDIGFAFLPEYGNNGYAYEAASAVLMHVTRIYNLSHILATTIPENINSIKLLKKLGLFFEKEIIDENIRLHVYSSEQR